MADSGSSFNASSVDLDNTPLVDIICYLNESGNDYDDRLGLHIASIFVILVVSTAVTFFPVLATRIRRLKIPLSVYLFARYFGAGVIIATAFVHLLDPAYEAIGPASCVGLTGGWSTYSWPPAIALSSAMIIFLLDFLAEYYVEKHYGLAHSPVENIITDAPGANGNGTNPHASHMHLHSADQDEQTKDINLVPVSKGEKFDSDYEELAHLVGDSEEIQKAFRSQISAFLVLEFGVIFHSVIIGLNLGVAGGDDFNTLFPVLVFHQSFEGLGIGARLSVIPIPTKWKWLPWVLCLAYGLTTPISIAIGLGLHNTYNGNSYTASVVSGVLDSISAGILIYTGLVEMLARDFLFNPNRTTNKKRLALMLVSLYLGCGIMALIGRWA
ncbi:zinc transporter protein [Pochonia chlamydosporia 170]|uniref:Zinc transporter protein n=1 Tax=Pochonia chlamydosporia 170 TaxID=1380566 RepID=A0A179F8M0_METCM|nr:zinc transporter protein [Pochonia chlamydosporia 170]OAQ61727.1 zinc transporter protein [Pochonia chlamydosporia 170]